MNYGTLNSEPRMSKGPIGTESDRVEMMERRVRRASSAKRMHVENYKGPRPQEKGERSSASSYFTAESFLVLAFLTASLLILPLILPPLPPPPSLLLLLPIGILVLLLILAFMPYDIRNIASSCL